MEQPVKRDVCTFKYLEKTHNVPATNVQVSFERHSEKMGVTNCKHVKSVRVSVNISYIKAFLTGLWKG